MYSPYGETHKAQREQVHVNQSKRVAGNFTPCAPAQAKNNLKINYYLNSPDAETLLAEQRFVAEKARRNKEDYKKRTQASLQQLRDARQNQISR